MLKYHMVYMRKIIYKQRAKSKIIVGRQIFFKTLGEQKIEGLGREKKPRE